MVQPARPDALTVEIRPQDTCMASPYQPQYTCFTLLHSLLRKTIKRNKWLSVCFVIIGDAILTNLEIKEDALVSGNRRASRSALYINVCLIEFTGLLSFPPLQSQLDIPFKVKAGHIGESFAQLPPSLFRRSRCRLLTHCLCLWVKTRSTGAEDPMEEPVHPVCGGHAGWRLSAHCAHCQ